MKFGGGKNPLACGPDVTRLLESSGAPPWGGPFAAPGETPPLPGSDSEAMTLAS
jgi:hypothetical protein